MLHSDAEHLQAAIEKIAKLRNEDLLNMKAWDYHELREAIEVESMLDVSAMILRSEYMRKESRVGVRRKDYPMIDVYKRQANDNVYRILELSGMKKLMSVMRMEPQRTVRGEGNGKR